MPPLAPFPTIPTPLPQAPGPKLGPFTPTATAKQIEFIQQLGNPENDKDGHVWKVRINGMQPCYALKMFTFNSSEYLKSISISRRLASPQLYFDYNDPFSCECRAYGRLKEEGREDLAVQAHGYLFLTPQQEAEITEKICWSEYPPAAMDAELDGENFWGRYEEHRHLPVRAIVKKLMVKPNPFTPEQLSNMWEDLEDIHRLGILVRDINVFNYMDAKFLDFSRSWVMPHPCLVYMQPSSLLEYLRSDVRGLESTIIDWGMGNRWDWDKVVIPEELQNCSSGEGQNGPYGIDPRQYDWRRLEKDPAAADAFLEENLFAE